jgi:hypothetical protein
MLFEEMWKTITSHVKAQGSRVAIMYHVTSLTFGFLRPRTRSGEAEAGNPLDALIPQYTTIS